MNALQPILNMCPTCGAHLQSPKFWGYRTIHQFLYWVLCPHCKQGCLCRFWMEV